MMITRLIHDGKFFPPFAGDRRRYRVAAWAAAGRRDSSSAVGQPDRHTRWVGDLF